MKNMGLSDLRLVSPPRGWKKKASIMAVFASDLLDKAKVFKNLSEAVSDMHLTIATSRRRGSHRGALLTLDESLSKIKGLGKGKKAAFIFGRESKGLSNEQLAVCDWVTSLPAHADYPSLNLAQAVMVVAFSLFRDLEQIKGEAGAVSVKKEEMFYVLERLEMAVDHLGYKPVIRERIRATFHSLMKRNGLTHSEGQMLKGISRRILERVSKKPGKTGKI